jgi:hypothetical protein
MVMINSGPEKKSLGIISVTQIIARPGAGAGPLPGPDPLAQVRA